ncbi:MAG TPA: hypothetical protein VE826_07725 [Dongiaceae bacterium]|nr:hypothetical protein [Dongiaceae bacterium]
MPARFGAPPPLAVAALALTCALAVPLRLSADVWAYAAYGALLGHGADPWSHAYRAADVVRFGDPLLSAALRAWDGSLPRDVYGPLFTGACALVVAATRPFGPGGTVVALRLLAAAGLLGCVALAGRRRPRLAALLAYHPVVLWSAAEGHNDVFWLALVLAADAVGAARARLSVLVAAAAVKAVALVPLVAALARVPPRRRAAASALAFAALAAAYAPLIWSAVAHGLDHATGPPRISLAHAAALAAASHSLAPLVVGAVLAVGAVAAVVRAVRAGDLLAGAALAAWLALPSPEPWYAIWLVPVVALAGRTPASCALLAASFTGLAGYVQDTVPGTALAHPALLGGTMLALYAVPLLVALLQPAPQPQRNAAPPTPPPLSTPSPTPAPTPAPTTTPIAPTPVPTAQPSLTPNPFTYIVEPPPPAAGTGPRITEIAANDRVLHKGGLLLVRITTSPDVTHVLARAMGREIGIPQMSPGVFSGQETLPTGIPFFMLNRTYQIEIVATTADGRSASFTVPVRLER